jgi:hypothetical protein
MFSTRSARPSSYSSFTAVILLASFVLMLSQAFAEATVPAASIHACCRAHGKHASSMHAECDGGMGGTKDTAFSSVQEKCPYGPLAASSFNAPDFVPGRTIASDAFVSVGRAHKVFSGYLPSLRLTRSNPKRGPPPETSL